MSDTVEYVCWSDTFGDDEEPLTVEAYDAQDAAKEYTQHKYLRDHDLDGILGMIVSVREKDADPSDAQEYEIDIDYTPYFYASPVRKKKS